MRAAPKRRPPTVVLWGGRPDVDLNAGGSADRIRTARLDRELELRRGFATMQRALGAAFRVHTVGLVEASKRAQRSLEAIARHAGSAGAALEGAQRARKGGRTVDELVAELRGRR